MTEDISSFTPLYYWASHTVELVSFPPQRNPQNAACNTHIKTHFWSCWSHWFLHSNFMTYHLFQLSWSLQNHLLTPLWLLISPFFQSNLMYLMFLIFEKIKNTITKNHVLLLTRKVIIHTQILYISLCVGLRTDPLTHSDILGCPLFFPMSSLTLWMSWITALASLFSLGPAESHLQEEGSHSFLLNQPRPKECIEGSAWITTRCHSPYWGGKNDTK